MLTRVIRRGQESFFIKAVLLVIAASFFVGFLVLPAARRGNAEDIVAVIGGENVYRREVANAILNIRARYREQVGDAYDQMKDYFEQRIPQQAWDQLVERRVAEVYAAKVGYVTSPDELRRLIQENPNFQVDGKFSKRLYEKFLDRNRYTATVFESDLARDYALQKFRGFLLSQVKISEAELQQRYRDENTKVELEAFLVDPAEFTDKVELTDEEIQKYYDDHSVDFLQPEKRDVVYFVYDGKGAPFMGLPEVNNISEEEVLAYYNQNQSKYTLAEKNWRVQDILLATKPADDEDKRSEEQRKKDAKKKAEEALAELVKGRPFDEVANEYSEDLATKRLQNGGVLAGGYITSGYFKKKVFEVFSKLEEGARSDVFEAEDGYHIVRVRRIFEGGSVKPLEDVRDTIRTSLRQEKSIEAARKQAEEDLKALGGKSLRDFAIEDPQNRRLEVASIVRDEPLPRVGKDPALVNKIFDELTPDSLPVLLDFNGRLVLLKVERVRPPEPSPLAEVRGEVEKILREDKSQAKAREAAEEIRQEVAGGASGARLSKKYKSLVVQDIKAFSRTGRESGEGGSGPDFIPELGRATELKAVAFTLTKENPVTPGVYQVGKKIAFARLKKRTDADPEGYKIARTALESKLQQEAQNQLYNEWIAEAKKHVSVDVKVPIEEIAATLASAS